MVKKNSNKFNIIVMTLCVAILFVSLIGYSGAWFTDSDSISGQGVSPNVHVIICDKNGSSSIDTPINLETSKLVSSSVTLAQGTGDSNYNGIYIKPDSDNTVNVYVRVFISLTWVYPQNADDSSPLSYVSPSVSSDWIKSNDGFYYYKTSVLSTSKSVVLLFNAFEVKNTVVPSDISVSVAVEAVQANAYGLSKWGDSVPSTLK